LIVLQKTDEAFEKLDSAYRYAKNCDDPNKKSEHFIKDSPDSSKVRLLQSLLEDLKGEYGLIAIPTDPQLYNDPRYTALISKVEADIAETLSS
jgi:hypothetical protein